MAQHPCGVWKGEVEVRDIWDWGSGRRSSSEAGLEVREDSITWGAALRAVAGCRSSCTRKGGSLAQGLDLGSRGRGSRFVSGQEWGEGPQADGRRAECGPGGWRLALGRETQPSLPGLHSASPVPVNPRGPPSGRTPVQPEPSGVPPPHPLPA